RLAGVYERTGATDQAIAAYESIVKAGATSLSTHLSLMRLYIARKDTTKAFELAKAARKLAPEDPEVTQALGRLAFLNGDPVWSSTLLQEAARKRPDDPEVYYDLAESSYTIGRTAEAETAMHHALELSASFPRAENARRFLEMTKLAANPKEA